MSAHVLLNLLNELGKRDQMQGLPSILSLFRSKCNKFNNAGAQMLDILTLRILYNLISGVKRYTFVIMYATLLLTFPANLYLWFIDFIAWVFFTPRRDVT